MVDKKLKRMVELTNIEPKIRAVINKLRDDAMEKTYEFMKSQEEKTIQGLCNCEDFVAFIKKNYFIKISHITGKCQLIRKRDDKILVEWDEEKFTEILGDDIGKFH